MPKEASKTGLKNGPKTTVRTVGLIGHPVSHSRSPAMQQAAFDALGIAAQYDVWDTPADQLARRVAALRAPEMLGANVTIPHKAAVAALLDAIAPDARQHTGVVNTIVRDESPQGVRLIGYNTDFTSLLRVLDEHDAWATGQPGQAGSDGGRGVTRVLVLGAGGAAQAALGAAAWRGAQPWVAARRRGAARRALEALYLRQQNQPAAATPDVFAVSKGNSGKHAAAPLTLPNEWKQRALSFEDEAALAAVLAETHILINATPVGTRDPQASPIPLASLQLLPRGAFVLDMVYNPPETALVRAAHAAGLRAAGGLSMLLYQGAEAFTLWTQRPAPLAIMRAALEASLRDEARSM
ncbi:MAG: shikimate dehydrogenase [Ktedonobacterales bacterium]